VGIIVLKGINDLTKMSLIEILSIIWKIIQIAFHVTIGNILVVFMRYTFKTTSDFSISNIVRDLTKFF